MMNYKKLALTVAAGAMATTMMARVAGALESVRLLRTSLSYSWPVAYP